MWARVAGALATRRPIPGWIGGAGEAGAWEKRHGGCDRGGGGPPLGWGFFLGGPVS
jgi:hypothetical protein